MKTFFEYYMENGIEIVENDSLGITLCSSSSKDVSYSGKFVLRIPTFLHRILAERAKANKVSLNTLCVSLLRLGFWNG